jgi:2-dehydropantoate 2-reductase
MQNLKQKLKIAVLGAGAVGSLVGGLLSKNGFNVTLIGRAEHCAKINQDGLLVRGAAGDFTVPVKAADRLDFKPDILFLCMKSQDLADSCSSVKKHAGNSLCVTMQNGVHADEIAGKALGHTRIIGAIVQFNAMYLKPGCVEYGGKGPLILGDYFGGNSNDLHCLQNVLASCFRVELSDNITGARYMKLLINIMANSLGAVSGLTAAEYTKYRIYRRLAALLLRESALVYAAAGIKPESIPGLSAEDLYRLVKAPLFISSGVLGRILGRGVFSHTKPSTLQSLLRKKVSEVDALNGEITRLADTMHLKAPLNAEIIRQCRRIEKDGRFLTPEKAKKIFFGSDM